MEVHTSSGPTPVPFGSVNRQWRELLAMRQNGDVLWELYSNEEWVAGRVGQAGVALIRDGKVVGLILSAPRRGRVTAGGCRGFRGRRYICANRPDERSEIAERDGTRESCGMNPYHDKALGESESAIGPVEKILRNGRHPLHFGLNERKECEWKTRW